MRPGLSWARGPQLQDWQGERLDVGYAIDVLHPLANEKRNAA